MEDNLFKSKIIEIITNFNVDYEYATEGADEVMKLWTDFIHWLHQPKCPFSVHWDEWCGKDKKISYDRLQGNYTLDQVMDWYVRNVLRT
jgi:hypothetical protein